MALNKYRKPAATGAASHGDMPTHHWSDRIRGVAGNAPTFGHCYRYVITQIVVGREKD